MWSIDFFLPRTPFKQLPRVHLITAENSKLCLRRQFIFKLLLQKKDAILQDARLTTVGTLYFCEMQALLARPYWPRYYI